MKTKAVSTHSLIAYDQKEYKYRSKKQFDELGITAAVPLKTLLGYGDGIPNENPCRIGQKLGTGFDSEAALFPRKQSVG